MLTPQSFSHNQFGTIRVLEIDGKIYFPATKCAEILGYQNPKDAILRHCKKDGVVNHDLIDRLGRNQSVKFISEGNLYRLIAKSKLPSAQKFESWVFDEVLPEVRKKGIRTPADLFEEIIANPMYFSDVLRNLANEKNARLKAEETVKLQSQTIAELQPKASYYDEILSSPNPISISEIAQDYGMSGQRLNRILQFYGVQYYLERSQCWLLHSKYLGFGYTKIVPDHADKTYKKQHMYWTQKGRLFLYDFLKKHHIYPANESLFDPDNF